MSSTPSQTECNPERLPAAYGNQHPGHHTFRVFWANTQPTFTNKFHDIGGSCEDDWNGGPAHSMATYVGAKSDSDTRGAHWSTPATGYNNGTFNVPYTNFGTEPGPFSGVPQM